MVLYIEVCIGCGVFTKARQSCQLSNSKRLLAVTQQPVLHAHQALLQRLMATRSQATWYVLLLAAQPMCYICFVRHFQKHECIEWHFFVLYLDCLKLACGVSRWWCMMSLLLGWTRWHPQSWRISLGHCKARGAWATAVKASPVTLWSHISIAPSGEL